MFHFLSCLMLPSAIIRCILFLGYAHLVACTRPSSSVTSAADLGNNSPYSFSQPSVNIPNCFKNSSFDSHTSSFSSLHSRRHFWSVNRMQPRMALVSSSGRLNMA